MERRISLLQDSRKAILFFVCAEGKQAAAEADICFTCAQQRSKVLRRQNGKCESTASRAATAEGKQAAAEAAVYIEEFDYWKSSLMNMMQPEKEGSAGSQR